MHDLIATVLDHSDTGITHTACMYCYRTLQICKRWIFHLSKLRHCKDKNKQNIQPRKARQPLQPKSPDINVIQKCKNIKNQNGRTYQI